MRLFLHARICRSVALFARFVVLLILCFAARSASAQTQFVWIEGEAPASINVKPNVSGWGHAEFLSGAKWLQVSIDDNKVEKEQPDEGVLIRYKAPIAKAGTYEIWNRIGYEFVRSPFLWRIDSGAWKTVEPSELTTDLMELQDWNEVAWLKLGSQALTAGAHTLEIKLPKSKDAQGKYRHVLYASDALCLTDGPFYPNGKLKPGQEAQSPQDRQAAAQSFALPLPMGYGYRSSTALNGVWQVCRADEQLPGEVAAPMKGLPAHAHWSGIAVPGDKNALRPDLLMAHRIWYRTRVNVPAALIGRSFQIVFPQNSLNTTVYVNGVLCGFGRNPFARFEADVTKGVKAGANEILVGIRDAWYGRATNPKDPMKLRKVFNLPLHYFSDGFQDMAYPVWAAPQSGILFTPTFIASGPVRAADVFCRPSTARKALDVDVTVSNPSKSAASGTVVCEVVDPKTGKVEKALPPQPYTLAPGGEKTLTVSDAWENPRLWWPDDPQMYNLRTTVKLGQKPVDVSETPFGFREWGISGKDFTLNGIVWRVWADLQGGETPNDWLDVYRKTNQRTMRLAGAAQGGNYWKGLTTDQALDFFDANGVVVRRGGPLDGERIGYNAIENDPELRKLTNSDIKMDLMRNSLEQMVAQVKGERNHPSIMIWSLENEWLYINCINLYGDKMDAFEAEIKKLSDAVRAADPTRPTMTDGGGANKDQSMPVHGNHYVFAESDTRYPDLAYEANPLGGGRGRWTWDEKRPRFLGEDYYATGINPADYAIFGGEDVFLGKTYAYPAAGTIYRMLMEGYRWAGFGGWQFWLGQDGAVNQNNSNPWLAVFCRQWDWTFGSGQQVKRTFGIFNDTRFSDPVSFAWSLTIDGKKIAEAGTEVTVPAGTDTRFDVTLPMPIVTARAEGELVYTLTKGGREVYRDVKAVSVLPPFRLESASANSVGGARLASLAPADLPPILAVGAQGVRQTGIENTRLENAAVLRTGFDARALGSPFPARNERTREGGQGVRPDLVLFDPQGGTAAFLQSHGVAFTQLNSLESLPDSGKVLIVGKDALSSADSTSPKLAAFAASGHSVIVLEQMNPLRYQALPAEMEPTTAQGRIAYGEDLSHPALRGLKQKDFFTWGQDVLLYANAYLKPTRGAKSLIQCDSRLQNTALVEVPVGKGVLLLCQVRTVANLSTNAVAQHLLANLIEYGSAYKQEFRQTVAVSKDASPMLFKTLDAMGLLYSKADDPLQALASGAKLAVIPASPDNLKQLAEGRDKVSDFTKAGGFIVLHGLTPEGLASYNRLVGFDHMIRPFRRERVSFPAPKSPLTSGLTLGDVVMLSGERIFDFTADEFVASDEFSYVVDLEDVAPFARFENDFAQMMTNGFVSADAWKYIVNVPAPDNPPLDFKLAFPKPQELVGMEWIGNTFYYPVTKVQLLFDGNAGAPATFAVKPTNDPQDIAISPSISGQNLTLRLADWIKKPGVNQVTGLDNIRLYAKRPADFHERVRPLLNIGGMVEYPRGSGGIVLCNLLLKEAETVPANATKKRTILGALLRNLKAPFGGKSVIVGTPLKFTPIDISKQANQYRDEKGWFGDKNLTFKDLPTGSQTFGGVPYTIFTFATSPVPTAIMLGGNGIPNGPAEEVKGIPVDRKADALFFLHTARLDSRRSEQEIREKKKYEMLRYVVHYADGQALTIPIYAETDIEDYRQKTPASLSGAALVWTRPFAGTDQSAAAYAKQWDNPRPDVAIASIDVVYGPDRRGVPALLAITAATAP